MKKILLLFCFAICASLSYGQFKVYQNGNMRAGGTAGTQPAEKLAVDGRVLMEDGSVVRTGASASLMFDRQDESAFIIGAGNDAGMSWDQAYNFELRSNLRSRITVNRFIQNGTLRFFINGSTGNTGIGRSVPIEKLDVNGSIRYNGSSYNASDKTLKSNINEFSYGLDEVIKLNPVSYTYNGKADIDNNGKAHTGLLAQELQKVAPELVSEFEHIEYVDDEKTEILSKENFLQIEESAIKYMLINAIKDQQNLIEIQNERISQLEEVISTTGSSDGTNRTALILSNYDLAELEQNIPNPFSGSTTINYIVPSDAQNAQISVFGTNGQLLKTLVINHVGAGALDINAQDLPSGTYSYQLIVDGRSIDSKKMAQVK